MDRDGDGGGARVPVPHALGLPREVPPPSAGEGRRGAWSRCVAGRRRRAGAPRLLARRVRSGAEGGDPRLPDDEPGVGRPVHEDRRSRHGRRRCRLASRRRRAGVRDPGRRRHLDRDRADQDGRPGSRQRHEWGSRGSAVSSVTRVVLREQVKELILERILNETYRPGERLVETRIAAELGTSQAPVREALRDLELLRFVESEPFRGARVRDVSQEELIEIYPVRAAIEAVAAREAAERLGGDVEALAAELDSMHRAADAEDLHALVEHDVAFHRLIVEASGNRVLFETWLSLGIEARTIVTALRAGLDGHEIAERHRPVLEALRARDPELAGTTLHRHVEQFGELLKGATAV